MSTAQMVERRFRAMNTEIAAWVWSASPQAAGGLAGLEDRFSQVEAELSRFRPNSGLSRLNAAAGAGPQKVSPLLMAVLQRALAAAARSDGIYDPTILQAIRAAGYDRSFEQLAGAPSAGPETTPAAGASGRRGDWRSVQLNRQAGAVTLPAGMGIDLGGIGKGWTVDRAAETAGAWGAALVDAGGDIRATAAPGGEPWPIGVQDPFNPSADRLVLALGEGAVATSSIGRRRWQRNGQEMHHLIDPRTGAPSRSDLHTATVLAPTAEEAEIAAKVALILGRREGRMYLEKQRLSAILIGHDGRQEMAGSLPLWQG